MSEKPGGDPLAITLLSEVAVVEQLAQSHLKRALPKGMEVSHFAVLNYLNTVGEERSPSQLSRSFNVTKGAMTNTLSKLEVAGYVAIRPAWEDARRKLVTISPAGQRAWEEATRAIGPLAQKIDAELGEDELKALLRAFRKLRHVLANS